MSSETDLNELIARRVRELRSALGLSLDAVAEKSGVSRSMISLIERAETNATAVVLDRIAAALGCTLTAFLDRGEVASNPLSKRRSQPTWCDPESGYVRRMLSPPKFASPIDLIEVTFPAGARVAYAATEGRELDQQIWIISGAMNIEFGGTTFALEAGDCLATKVAQPIVYTNPYSKAARYVVALASNTSARRH